MLPQECKQIIEDFRQSEDYQDQITHHEFIPERPPQFSELSSPLPPALSQALKVQGIDRLYSHQVEAIDAMRNGENVCVVTSTASGKTLTYNAPVLENLIHDRAGSALYLFPTKALAQDQKRKLEELNLFPMIKAATYDGDTPQAERRFIRQVAQIVMSNPDMLHIGILPNHTLWSRFLRTLRYVVIDELHTYRGVFGAHMAHVVRRLRRICSHYGSEPQFICASATVANPEQAVAQLTGLPFRIVRDDGAPRYEKHFLLWNPPLLDDGGWLPGGKRESLSAMRRSANSEAVRLMKRLMERNVRTITFTRARVTAELILKYLRDELPARLKQKLMAYRAGYLPQERRQIERDLFEARLLGVASTNALELGVDIGGLDASLLVGYPGGIASTFQQAGRAGRAHGSALVILIAHDGPLDQYIVRHPEFLFGRGAEEVTIDPSNVYVLAAHLLCAAHELPIAERDLTLFGLTNEDVLLKLESAGLVDRRGRWFWKGANRPHDDVSIRAASGQAYEIRDLTRDRALIGMADADRAFSTVHEGAIYLHQGEPYVVERLDLGARCAYVRPVDSHYYTRPMSSSETSIVEAERQGELPNGIAVYFGTLKVTSAVIGYRRIQQFTERVLSVELLDLPSSEFETRGLWFSLPTNSPIHQLTNSPTDLGTLHAVEHAAIAMMPAVTTCDPDDVGGVSYDNHPETGEPSIFIYDGYPGGAGFSEKAFERIGELLEATLAMLRQCVCVTGCPACVQSPRCGNNNEPLDKAGAIALLKSLTDRSFVSAHSP